MNKTRVRFAPSPTGYLHIGSLRTVLYDYLFAKKSGADFILRVEDTDRKRYVPGSVEKLIESLEWAGLKWDEGIFTQKEIADDRATVTESVSYPGTFEAGEYGPYVQSERLELYRKYAEELVEKGHAYYCFCMPERLEELRNQQSAAKQAPMYDRYCLTDLSQEEINKKLKEECPHVIRLKVPKDEIIEFEDVVRGKVKFNTNTTDDQVLLKSDGFPTYHLAVVVDDHLMNITHVIRGEEWLPSTPKHIILYKALGWEPPKFAHLPLLLNPDKTKLSKRQGDVAVEDYTAKGYLKEAIINFVALLGWNPGDGETQEIFSMEELIEKFDLSRVHKAGAVFDIKKLDWINSEYIKRLSLDELHEKALPFFEKKDFYINAPTERKTDEYLKKVLAIEQERLAKLSEVGESNRFFFQDIDYAKELLKWKESSEEDTKASLQKTKDVLEKISDSDWTRENLQNLLMEAAGEKRGDLLWPLRASLTGEQKSPSPFEVAWVLGKDESLKRIGRAIEK
ncbi:MAG: glutamate--tRNA ligase [Candidatus Moranbacteria bacterium]|nr:glutamate--tRNA ligase [Candidatus Moranbacteria bacterium]